MCMFFFTQLCLILLLKEDMLMQSEIAQLWALLQCHSVWFRAQCKAEQIQSMKYSIGWCFDLNCVNVSHFDPLQVVGRCIARHNFGCLKMYFCNLALDG